MKEGYKRLTVEIDENLHREAKIKSYQEGKTLTDKMVELMKKWLTAK